MRDCLTTQNTTELVEGNSSYVPESPDREHQLATTRQEHSDSRAASAKLVESGVIPSCKIEQEPDGAIFTEDGILKKVPGIGAPFPPHDMPPDYSDPDESNIKPDEKDPSERPLPPEPEYPLSERF
ncbi:MAG: hypothetical protein KC777_21565 [Cyanobacteria bacterium HKST-UBA02]|nr:hypothetical protein [Cyanobacteria bacterium HKST-UBA02]